MKVKYDFLVTTYNKEKYIKKCIDSILNQTYKNFNLIIVDDGSTDNTRDIIQKYMQKYSNIKYYYKENSGVADTRNFAITKVTAPYFLFVDADDYVTENLLESLDKYVKNNIDIVSFCGIYVDEDMLNYTKIKKATFDISSGKDALIAFTNPQNYVCFDVPWGYIYNTDFFIKNNFTYLSGTVHEDIELTPIVIYTASKIVSTNIFGYYYLQSPQSITRNTDTTLSRIDDLLLHYRNLYKFYNKEFKLKKIDYAEIYQLKAKIIYDILYITTTLSYKDIKPYIKKIRKYKIYDIVPSFGWRKCYHRFIFKYFTIIPLMFYCALLYDGEIWLTPDLYFKNYLTFVHELTYRKFDYIKKDSKKYGKIITTLRRNLLFYKNSISYLPALNKNKLYIEYLELVITTNCTLCCKNCANLMPYYKNKSKNLPLSYINKQIDSLTQVVDKVCKFRILGGEPFCHPDLKYILTKLINIKKFPLIIIVTNGTIVPKDSELLKLLSNKKIEVFISNYKEKSRNLTKLIKTFNKYNICWKKSSDIHTWTDFGVPINHERNEIELEKQFSKCKIGYTKCTSLFNGKIHVCPRSAHGMDLNLIPDNSHDYVDIMNDETNEIKKAKIKELLFSKKYVSACNYCNFGTKNARNIEVATQCTKNELDNILNKNQHTTF